MLKKCYAAQLKAVRHGLSVDSHLTALRPLTLGHLNHVHTRPESIPFHILPDLRRHAGKTPRTCSIQRINHAIYRFTRNHPRNTRRSFHLQDSVLHAEVSHSKPSPGLSKSNVQADESAVRFATHSWNHHRLPVRALHVPTLSAYHAGRTSLFLPRSYSVPWKPH